MKINLKLLIVLTILISCVSTSCSQNRNVILIGASSPALTEMKEILSRKGLQITLNKKPSENDIVLFSVSSLKGVSWKTFDALDQCVGTKISIAAILLTQVNSTLDPELLELVELELKSVLEYMIDVELDYELKVLYSNDINLDKKILNLKKFANTPKIIKAPNRAAWKRYIDEF